METCYFDFDGGRIAYDEMGRGPLIICIPSMGDVRAEYRFLAPQLASAYYHVISIDVRGHGESSTNWSDYSVTAIGRDLIALIRTIDAGPAVLIGTSMGAGAAVYAAGEAPELVAGVLLIDPFVRGRPSLWSGLLYSALLTQPWGPSAWIRYYSTLYPTHKPQDFAQYTAALKRNLEEPGRMNALKQMALASKAESEKQLPCVTAPAVVIMGSKDPDFQRA